MTKLFKLEIVAMPESAFRQVLAAELPEYELESYGLYSDELTPGQTVSEYVEGWEPEGWLSDPEKREWWIERTGSTDFFWPKSTTIYFTKRTAQNRARLIESYGATVKVIESEAVVWLTPERVKTNRIAELRAELDALTAVNS